MLKIESFQVRIVEAIIALLLTFIVSISLYNEILLRFAEKRKTNTL